MKIFDGPLTTLERALDVRSHKQAQLANAIANVDTPAFRPLDVDFAASMIAAAESEPVVVRGAEAAPTADGNTVDLDRTLAALAENGVRYGAAAKMAAKHLALLRHVASDGVG